MSRHVKWPPSILEHKPSGQARIRWAGRDIYLGPYGSPEAAKEYARVISEIAATGFGSKKGVEPWQDATVSSMVAAWRHSAKGRYGDSKELKQFTLALEPLLALYGETPVKDFRVPQLEAVQLAMATGSWMSPELLEQRGKRHRIGWCRSVINRHIVRIRTVWRWADGHGHAPPGSWEHLLSLPGAALNDKRFRSSKVHRSVTWEEVLAVVRQAPRVVKFMLLLQWWTGMRSAEVRTMRAGEIEQGGAVWLYRPPQHKNLWRGHVRIVPLGPKCQALVKPWLRDGADFLFAPSRRRPKGNPCYRDWGYAQAVRRAAATAGVEGFRPYACRHAAKDRITRARGLDDARAVLGQLSIGTTNEYGRQIDLEAAIEAAKKLG